MNADLTPETIAELRRLLDECKPGRVIVNDLRPTHNAIWLDSRYDSDDGWERLRTLAEIDTETETVEVMWGLDDAILIAAAVNALPALLDAAAERDALAAKVERVRALHRPAYNDVARSPMCEDCGGKAGVHPCGCWAENDYEFVCAVCNQGTKNQSVPWPCPTVRALDCAKAAGWQR